MKVIAVSQRVDVHPDRNETRDALDQRLVKFLIECGGLPVPVPNSLGVPLGSWLERLQPRMCVLSGGNDIHRCEDRDATERALLDYAKNNKLPVLGICRGMQMMGVWAGAALKPVTGHVRTYHQLTGVIERRANSYHDYALAECPAGFNVSARSEDGEIEAIQHRDLPWTGWMWHPEREDEFNSPDIDYVKQMLA